MNRSPAKLVAVALPLVLGCQERSPHVTGLHWVPLRTGDGPTTQRPEPIIEGGQGQITVDGRIATGSHCPAVVASAEASGRLIRVAVEARPSPAEGSCAQSAEIIGVAYTFSVAGLSPGVVDVELTQTLRGVAPDSASVHRHMVAVQ